MSTPTVVPTAAGAAARSTGFGTTVFDVVAPTVQRRRGLDSAFDVCHVGVVLRALLFVHGVMAIGMVFGATGFAAWLALTAAGASVALPAVLLWLLVVCGLKAPLNRAPLALQWLTVIALGALAALAASRLIAAMLPDASAVGFGSLVGYGPPLAGAAMAAAIFQWLRLLAQATLPAE
ncbi:MAG TPA: sensor histidine kinase, partial [Caldimonas sp.]